MFDKNYDVPGKIIVKGSPAIGFMPKYLVRELVSCLKLFFNYSLAVIS